MPAVPGAWMAADAATGTVMTLSWTCTRTKACGSSRVRNHPPGPGAAPDGRGPPRAGLEPSRTTAGGEPGPAAVWDRHTGLATGGPGTHADVWNSKPVGLRSPALCNENESISN